MIYTAKVSIHNGKRSFKSATVKGISASSLTEASSIAISEFSRASSCEKSRVILNSIWHDYPQPTNKSNIALKVEM
jgi:hypothetical protein